MSVVISSVYQNNLQTLVTPAELSRSLRRADDFIKLAVVAAFEILRQQDIEPDQRGDDFGLIIGTSYGTMQTNFEVLDTVVTDQQSSPTLFSHSVFNAAAGYTAAVLNLRGCGLTVTDFTFPFFRALQEGYLALVSGRLSRCLVFQVETYSGLLSDARKKEIPGCSTWPPGVVCWLLENEDVCEKSVGKIEGINLVDTKYTPAKSLNFSEQVLINNEISSADDPLSAAKLITEAVLAGDLEKTSICQVMGPWGNAEVRFC